MPLQKKTGINTHTHVHTTYSKCFIQVQAVSRNRRLNSFCIKKIEATTKTDHVAMMDIGSQNAGCYLNGTTVRRNQTYFMGRDPAVCVSVCAALSLGIFYLYLYPSVSIPLYICLPDYLSACLYKYETDTDGCISFYRNPLLSRRARDANVIQAGAVVGGGALSRVLGAALKEGDAPGEDVFFCTLFFVSFPFSAFRFSLFFCFSVLTGFCFV